MKNQYAIPLSWRNALLSVVVTLGLWVVPWLVWPSVRTEASVERRTPPVIRYVRAAEGIDGAAWSPVVFPLPTKEGFSKKAISLESGQDMASVLKPHVSEAAYLEVLPERTPAAEVGLLTVQDEVAFRPQAVTAERFTPAGLPRQDGLRIERDDALTKRAFDAPALKRFQPAEAGLPWLSATAYVELDQQGRVQHVFLENPSGQTNVDGLIVRALYMGTAAPDTTQGYGRVRLNYWKTVTTKGEIKN